MTLLREDNTPCSGRSFVRDRSVRRGLAFPGHRLVQTQHAYTAAVHECVRPFLTESAVLQEKQTRRLAVCTFHPCSRERQRPNIVDNLAREVVEIRVEPFPHVSQLSHKIVATVRTFGRMRAIRNAKRDHTRSTVSTWIGAVRAVGSTMLARPHRFVRRNDPARRG